jgi:hypothetical protein
MFKCLFSSGDALDAFDAHLTHCNLAQISISGTVESELDPTIALEFSWRVPGAKKAVFLMKKLSQHRTKTWKLWKTIMEL